MQNIREISEICPRRRDTAVYRCLPLRGERILHQVARARLPVQAGARDRSRDVLLRRRLYHVCKEGRPGKHRRLPLHERREARRTGEGAPHTDRRVSDLWRNGRTGPGSNSGRSRGSPATRTTCNTGSCRPSTWETTSRRQESRSCSRRAAMRSTSMPRRCFRRYRPCNFRGSHSRASSITRPESAAVEIGTVMFGREEPRHGRGSPGSHGTGPPGDPAARIYAESHRLRCGGDPGSP